MTDRELRTLLGRMSDEELGDLFARVRGGASAPDAARTPDQQRLLTEIKIRASGVALGYRRRRVHEDDPIRDRLRQIGQASAASSGSGRKDVH